LAPPTGRVARLGPWKQSKSKSPVQTRPSKKKKKEKRKKNPKKLSNVLEELKKGFQRHQREILRVVETPARGERVSPLDLAFVKPKAFLGDKIRGRGQRSPELGEK